MTNSFTIRRAKAMGVAAGVLASALVLAGCSTAVPETEPEESPQSAAVGVPEGMLSDGTLRIAISQSPPYSQKDDSGNWAGIDVDLTTAIAELLGVVPEYIDTKFDALIPGLDADRFDITINVGDFVERQESATFVDYAQSKLTVEVQTEGKFQPKELLDLCEAQIGFEQSTAGGTTANAVLAEECPKAGLGYVEWQGFPDRTALELALRSNRIDGLAAPISGNDLSASQSDGKFTNLVVVGLDELPGTQAIYGVVLKKDSPLAPAILEALQILVENGQYQEVFDQWDLPNGSLETSQILIDGSTLTRN